MNISSITIGSRTRKHLGDIQQLADSIQAIGLLHPIVVTPDNKLVAGYRRLMAYKLLGKDDIPCTVADSLDGLLSTLAEQHENTCRLDFTPSEAVEIGRMVEPLEREAAKERLAVRSEKFSEVKNGDKGNALAKNLLTMVKNCGTMVEPSNSITSQAYKIVVCPPVGY